MEGRRYEVLPDGSLALSTYGMGEQDLYDSLGPRARLAIAETPIDIDVRGVLVAFRNRHAHDLYDHGSERSLPLADPKADDLLARFVYGEIRAKVPDWRPIKHRPSARGARIARAGLRGRERAYGRRADEPAA